MANIPDMHFHVHIDGHEVLHEILKELHHLKNLIMANKEQFDQVFADINAALSDQATALTDQAASISNIADDITRLTEQLQTGGLTEAQEQDILNQLTEVGARARASADQAQASAAAAKTIADRTPETPPTT